MHTESKMTAKQTGGAATIARRLATLTALAALMGPAAAHAAEKAVTFEAIPGGPLKRVILTAKAAERLGIETGAVTEKTIVRTQMFGGQVSHPLRVEMVQKNAPANSGGFTVVAARPAAPPIAAAPLVPMPGEAWIALALSPEEWDRIAQDKPARLLPLSTREQPKQELTAEVSKLPPIEDPKREMVTVYYVAKGADQGLAPNTRLRVELPLKGTNEKHKVVPYSALYYDNKGVPWVYLNPKPLTYERQKVEVERIVGDDAILKDGPSVGTKVVTIGSSFLYGAEVIFKK